MTFRSFQPDDIIQENMTLVWTIASMVIVNSYNAIFTPIIGHGGTPFTKTFPKIAFPVISLGNIWLQPMLFVVVEGRSYLVRMLVVVGYSEANKESWPISCNLSKFHNMHWEFILKYYLEELSFLCSSEFGYFIGYS